MAIDRELAAFLSDPPPNDMDDITTTRRLAAILVEEEIAQRGSPLPGMSWHDEVTDAVLNNCQVPIRIYRSEAATKPSGALLFFHGGAFVFGGLESEHERCLRLANRGECMVVSVDYRLAPENPFPAAIDDGATALNWLRRNTEFLNVDHQRIGVGGASAGGAVAAGLALRTRDSEGSWLRAQMLIYPALDNQAETTSIEQFYQHVPWDGERTRKMWMAYLGDDSDNVSPYASVTRATCLANLPPTYVMTTEEDPLRDEAIAYAQRLLLAGNTVELHHFPRTFHGFDIIAPGTLLSELALEEQAGFLRRELGRAT
jgi:acetyl esterase/lipase